MSRESNYFGQAIKLLVHPEPLLSNTAKALYSKMRLEYADHGKEPSGDFNIYYFFLTVSNALAKCTGEQNVLTLIRETNYSAIKVVNVPSSSQMCTFSERSMLASEVVPIYSELVKGQSVERGDDYDLRYSLEILCDTFAEVEIQDLQKPPGSGWDDEHDEWLSRFVDPDME